MNRTAPSPASRRASAPGRRTNKLAVIRARCTDDLKHLVERAAERLELDEADVIRMGVREFAMRVTQPQPLPAIS